MRGDLSDEELLFEIREAVRKNNKILNKGKKVKMLKNLISLILIIVVIYYARVWYVNNTEIVEEIKANTLEFYKDGKETFKILKNLSASIGKLSSQSSNSEDK